MEISMILQDENELKIPSKGGVKNVKMGELYIPYTAKIKCRCEDCQKEFNLHYLTAIKKKEHYCVKCRFKGDRNGMSGKGDSIRGEKNHFYGKHHSVETLEKLRELNTGEKNSFYGKHHSEETKIILRNVDKSYTKTDTYRENMKNVVTGRRHSESTKNKISISNKKALSKRNPKNFRSKLEKSFEEWLNSIGLKKDVDYKVQLMLHDEITGTYKFYDFYIFNKNLIIEIDGTYWHNRNKENDKFKTLLAEREGYKLIRITDVDIKNNLHETKYKKDIISI